MKNMLLASILSLFAFCFSTVYTPTAAAANDDGTVFVKKGKKKGKKGKKKGKKNKNNASAYQFVAAKGAKKANKAKKGSADNGTLFKKLDADGDNKLSKDEFSKVTGQGGKKKGNAAKKAGKQSGKIDAEFAKLDENKDGYLSQDEFKKFSAADLKGAKKKKKNA